MTNALTEKSKFLSYVLRHKPEAAKLTLDKEGWCNIEQLIKNTNLTLEEIEQIVAEDSKGRYTIKYWEMGGGGLPETKEPFKIRANQGHSTSDVRLTFNKAVPPVELYHGTNDKIIGAIMKEGLLPMNRHHVHLSKDRQVAETVGGRRKGGLVILKIDCKAMLADGHAFFLSENGIWLVDAVPAKYISQDLT
jgi:putative RNA 2'-phosphotransferase